VTLAKFLAEAEFAKHGEVNRVCLLAFYHLKKNQVAEFTASDYASWIDGHPYAKPNITRLTANLRSSRDTLAGSKKGSFRLHHKVIGELDAKFPALSEKSEEITDDGTILPPILYEKTLGFVQSLAKQINGSYENNIFDGCAVLMRRLEEVLLIMSYEKLGIAAEIKDPNSGSYYMLERIVGNAAVNGTLNLSRNSKQSIETFRNLGNYSAHKITYICRKQYIKEKIDEYRALIDELLHKSGLRT
jgi:hypothetical protein